jgi:hypothetical protein
MLFDPAFAHLMTTKLSATSTAPVIASPVHGVDTSLSSTMFIDTGAVTPASAGQTVAAINDAFGGTTRNFQQSESTSRPQLVASLAAGYPGLRFNGTSTYMQLFPLGSAGVPFQGRNFTFSIVYRRSTAASGGFEDTLFFAGNQAGGSNGDWLDHVIAYVQSDGLPAVGRATGSEATYVGLTSATYQSGALTKLVCRGSQANGIEFRVRSSAGAFSGTGAIPSSADLFTWDATVLGCGPTYQGVTFPAYFYEGDLFELRFWASRAGDTEFSALQSHLDTKWGS